MKAPQYHSSRTYSIKSNVFFIREAGASSPLHRHPSPDPELIRRFRDAALLYRSRIELLSHIDHITTEAEAESLRVMLEALLEGKRRLQHN